MHIIKDYYNNSKLNFILTIITLVIFLVILPFSINVVLKNYGIIIFCQICLLFLFPFLIYLIMTIIKTKYIEKLKLIKIIDIISYLITMFLIFYYLIAAVFLILAITINPITNHKSYNYVYESYKDYIGNFFPSSIPSSAKNIKFYYIPAFLQGGMEITLYYDDNEENINDYINKLKDKAWWIGTTDDDYGKYKDNMPNSFYNTPYRGTLPNSFTIYLMDSYCDDSGYCNHGDYILVAIDENSNEIIFQASIW